VRGQAAAIARAISEENDAERLNRARAEMDDDERARHERLLKEQTDLQRALERSRERVGVDPEDLHRVTAAALSRAGYMLDNARGASVGNVETFRLNPSDQTRNGIWGTQDWKKRPERYLNELCVGVINVAETELKLKCESPLIGRAVVGNIEHLLRVYEDQDLHQQKALNRSS
jgi:hypothetical protein